MKKIAKKDNNHNQIVKELRQLGASVFETHQLGNGFPDIVVGFRGRNYLFEIKLKKNSKLTPMERKFLSTWNGQVNIIFSFEDALKILGEDRE